MTDSTHSGGGDNLGLSNNPTPISSRAATPGTEGRRTPTGLRAWAREAYDNDIVVELKSEKTEDIDSSVERIEQWIKNWKKDNDKDGDVKAHGKSEGGEKKDEDDPMFLHG